MNRIFLIRKNKVQQGVLHFHDNNDLFICEDGKFKFQIKSKEELIIYWGDDDVETFKTNDSFLYFSNNQKRYDTNHFKKMYVYQEEWKDQIICDGLNNTLQRLNKPDETGTYEIFDSNGKTYYKINWTKWGEEIFLLLSEKEIIKEGYLKTLEQKKKIKYSEEQYYSNEITVPIYLFIHVCTENNGIEIFEDIMNDVKSSGLYDVITQVFIGIVGSITNLKPFIDSKYKILYMDPQVLHYEIKTINSLLNFVKNGSDIQEAFIAYVHTKGVRKVGGNMECVWSWRKMMTYFIINQFQTCLDNLNSYDVIGVNLCNQFTESKDIVSVSKEHCIHFSGNYWWSKKSYIKNLPLLIDDLSEKSVFSRCRAENWICSEYPKAKIGFLFQDNTNTHPYHRYVFDEYKKCFPLIKDSIGIL